VYTGGGPAPGLTESGTLPAGITFVDNGDGTGTLAGTAAVGTAGTYALTFTAANGTQPDYVEPFTLTVYSAGALPTLQNITVPYQSSNTPAATITLADFKGAYSD